MRKIDLSKLRNNFPVGCRVELVRMNDQFAPPIGTQGNVMWIDDIGTIHVKWDNGSCLGVVYGEDLCKKIS